MRITSLLMVTALTLAACGDDESSSDTTVSAPTEPAVTEPVVSESPVTEPAVTEPAVTEPAVTEPPLADTTVSEPPPDPAAADDAECAPIAIDTGSVTTEGERCDPAGAADVVSPAALVLNGCGGYESDGELTAATVRALAAKGVVGVRVDWLGAVPAPPDTYCEAGPVVGAVDPLLEGLVDAVDRLRGEPGIDPDRIGVAAYSLGAIAAMAAEFGGAGLTDVAPLDLRAAALLSYPGQLPMIPDLAAELGTPPLFLMTGSEDETAPPRDSRILAQAARRSGSTAELVIVTGQDHPWRGDAAVQAGAALAEFLGAELATG